jgi:hypothetical protein
MTEESGTTTIGSAAPVGNTSGDGDSQLSTADIASTTVPRQSATVTETRSTDSQTAPLFPQNRLDDYRQRWTEIQTGFVDDPRAATEQADNLVDMVIKDLAQVFAQERETLEGRWASGQDESNEDLRVAITRYRSFFDRLLSV